VIRRIIAFILTAWLLGFAAFVILLPGPAPKTPTDAIIVLTGGPGRIQRGFAMQAAGLGKRILVSGVGSSVKPDEFAIAQNVPVSVMKCCVDLGKEAVDTRSNARESAKWIERGHYRSVRLVTTDWHMPRARFELARTLPPAVGLLPDAVNSEPDLLVLFTEYNKYLLRRVAVLAGD
jgi:uncharacterized SAM-binding protein YcdF (DUF218 family)